MEGEDEESEDERAFNNKKAWQKALIVVAGAAMNFILCVVILIGICIYSGSPTTTVGELTPDGPAKAAGLRVGDEIVRIDETQIREWTDITTAIGGAEDNVTIEVIRDGHQAIIHSDLVEEDGRMIIGIIPDRDHGFFLGIKNGIQSTKTMTVTMVDTFRMLFTGDVSMKELSGPVGIVYVVNDTAKMGIMYLFYLTALISLNLAIVNMLPLPALPFPLPQAARPNTSAPAINNAANVFPLFITFTSFRNSSFCLLLIRIFQMKQLSPAKKLVIIQPKDKSMSAALLIIITTYIF
jgi:regulator of sigma E protease